MDNHALLKLKEDLKTEILNELYGKKRSETEWNRLCDELLDPGLNDLFYYIYCKFTTLDRMKQPKIKSLNILFLISPTK